MKYCLLLFCTALCWVQVSPQQVPKEMGKMAAFGPCQKAARDKERGMVSASVPEVVDGNGPWQVGGRSLFLTATVP